MNPSICNLSLYTLMSGSPSLTPLVPVEYYLSPSQMQQLNKKLASPRIPDLSCACWRQWVLNVTEQCVALLSDIFSEVFNVYQLYIKRLITPKTWGNIFFVGSVF